jgi:hypothetical protein
MAAHVVSLKIKYGQGHTLMTFNQSTNTSIIIYVVCLVHPEEGREPPYSAFTNFEAARKYAQVNLPLDLGLEEFELKEDEDYRIYQVELQK